jgi:hypothetical protein
LLENLGGIERNVHGGPCAGAGGEVTRFLSISQEAPAARA